MVSIPVLSQDKALDFYTKTLGFEIKHDIPLGGENRWLTIVSPEEKEGPEVLLEPAPNNFEPAKVYQKALFDAGIPHAQFDVSDIQKEYDRLSKLGVKFSMAPKDVGMAKIAILEDGCGNHIQLVESK